MTGNQTDGLKRFCEAISKQYYAINCRIKTEDLTSRFRNFFELDGDLRLEAIITLCNKLGIEKIIEKKLPGAMRGVFHNYNGQYTIHYDQDDWIGRQEHTLLHEIYEIFETEISTMCSKFEKSNGFALERRADKFAACVLMPKERFEADMFETGLDIYKLRKTYNRAYSSVLIRMNSLLQEHFTFIGLGYEPEPMICNPLLKPDTQFTVKDFILKYQVNTSDLNKSNKKQHHIWKCIPSKGQLLTKNCIGYHVYKHQKAVKRVFSGGQDLFGYDDFIILGRPIMWEGIIVKIIVIGVPVDRENIMQPQIDLLQPVELGRVEVI